MSAHDPVANGIFITGTGTDVGKTIVTAGILRNLRRHGIDAVSMKPVQTGAERTENGLRAIDLVVHHNAADYEPEPSALELMAPYLYEHACSPHLAGRLAGMYPKLDHIQRCAEQLAERHDCILIEGAGGIMAPLDEWTTMLDLMETLALPVILVATRGLGTINHTLLSIRALRDARIEILGVVFNETQPIEPDYIRQDNPETVRAFGQIEILGNIDYLHTFESGSKTAWEQFERCMPGLHSIRQRFVTV